MKDFQWVTRLFQKLQEKKLTNIDDFLLSRSPTQGKDKKQDTKQENNSVFRYSFFIKVHLLCIAITVQTSAS